MKARRGLALCCVVMASLLLTLSAACGKDLLEIEPRVDGDVVYLTINPAETQLTVRLGSLEKHLDSYRELELAVAREALANNELSIEATDSEGNVGEIDIEADVEGGASGPFFRVFGCQLDGWDSVGVQVHVNVTGDFGEIERCGIARENLGMTLWAVTSPSAELTVGGEPVEVDSETGHAVVTLDLAKTLLEAPIRRAIDREEPVLVPVSVTVDGETLEGAIDLTYGWVTRERLVRAVFRRVAEHPLSPTAERPAGQAVRSAVLATHDEVLSVGENVTARHVDLVAVAVDTEGRPGRDCVYQTSTGTN